jgi:hypothetical protein
MPRLFLEAVKLLALVSVAHSDSPSASETAANSALITTSHAAKSVDPVGSTRTHNLAIQSSLGARPPGVDRFTECIDERPLTTRCRHWRMSVLGQLLQATSDPVMTNRNAPIIPEQLQSAEALARLGPVPLVKNSPPGPRCSGARASAGCRRQTARAADPLRNDTEWKAIEMRSAK